MQKENVLRSKWDDVFIYLYCLKMILIRGGIQLCIKCNLKRPKWLAKQWYNCVSYLCGKVFSDFDFMNYGYSSTDTDKESINEKHELYQKQLYNHLFSMHSSDSHDKLRVLEIGSGRGGGANYLATTFKLKEMVGLDISDKAIVYCTDKFGSTENLSFIQGESENVPFDDGYFDIVINVESSHCYPNLEKTFSEIKRVLKKDGSFLITDYRYSDKIDDLHKLLEKFFSVSQKNNITSNVVNSLNKDNKRKEEIIDAAVVPSFLKQILKAFAGCKSGETFKDFSLGDKTYISVLCKQQ